MKAITIWQPWASLLAHGMKQYETRSWATKYRGPIAIHAAKRPVRQTIDALVADRGDGWTTLDYFESLFMRPGELDHQLRERLMSIRGKVFGRQRVLLGDTPSDMVAPLEISEGLYLESRFDTESLLYVLTRRVLAPVGYNYNEVLIQLRS